MQKMNDGRCVGNVIEPFEDDKLSIAKGFAIHLFEALNISTDKKK